MKNRWLTALGSLLVSAGLATAQAPELLPPPPGAAVQPSAPPLTAAPALDEPMGVAGAAAESRFWASTDYLQWWIKHSQNTVPLLTTGDPTDVISGALGQPGTHVLLSGDRLRQDDMPGFRVQLGAWLNRAETVGVEGSFFYLPRQSSSFHRASDASGNPLLAIPFNDFNPTGQANQFAGVPPFENSIVISTPAAFGGSVATGAFDAKLVSRLWGAEGNATVNLVRNANLKVDLLAGFRYLDLQESFSQAFTSHQVAVGRFPALFFDGTPLAAGQSETASDSFRTRNQFYGGQVGTRLEYLWNRVLIGMTAKVALGETKEVREIAGSTQAFNANGTQLGNNVGGIFALPTNIGRLTNDRFAVVPELELKIGWRWRDWLTPYVSYNAIYWSEVARAIDQVDRNINSSQVPSGQNFAPFGLVGLPAPFPRVASHDFWAQGVNFGLEFRY